MTEMSQALDANTAATSAALARFGEDYAHVLELLEQALATDVDDAETIAALRADAAATTERINANTAVLAGIDPDPAFPAAEEPPVDPEDPEEPPVDPEVPVVPAPETDR